MTITRRIIARSPGFPSSILRFGVFVPTIIVGAQSLDHYKLLRHHSELEHAPYNPHTINAQYAAAVAGIFCFLWCILSFLPTFYLPPSAIFTVGCVDFGFAVVFVVASVLQGTYLPHTKETCRQAESWQIPPGTPSFFQAISNIPGSKDSAEVICKEYFTTWCTLVATATLWTLSALSNILLGGLMTKWTAYNFRYLWIMPLSLLGLICFPLRPFFPRLYYIWRYCQRCLQRISYHHGASSRFRISLKKGHHSHADIYLAKALSSGQPMESTGVSEKSPNLKPATGHGHYDVLPLISHHLHHIDIINLSLVSKRVHKAIFPNSMLDARSQRLRFYTCDNDMKALCWACNTQICRSCKKSKLCTDTRASFHLTNCKAYCSTCFYINVCEDINRRGPCECINRKFDPSYRSSNIFNDRWRLNRQSIDIDKYSRDICRSCDALTENELVARQNKRGVFTIGQLANQPLACEHCRISLPFKGPRWWVCMDCRQECPCGIHPSWAPGNGEV